MIYLLAGIAGIVAAVVGWFITGAIAVWIAGLYGVSDFEGGRGMFAFLFVGPLGGLVSMVGAVWLVLRLGRGQAPLLPSIGRVGAVLAAIALMVALGIALRLYSIDTYSNEAPPMLVFEIRVPSTVPAPDRAQIEVELHTDKNVGSGQLFSEWSLNGNHRVVAGGVDLAFKTTSRILVVSFADQPNRLFRLSLARDPASSATLGDWHRADHIDVRGEEQPRKAPADDPVEFRYRVRRAGEE
jgi:hypothetical protein